MFNVVAIFLFIGWYQYKGGNVFGLYAVLSTNKPICVSKHTDVFYNQYASEYEVRF